MLLSGTASSSSSSAAPAVSPAPLQRARSINAPRLAPPAPAIAPRRPGSEQSRATTRRGHTVKTMAATDDNDAAGSAPGAPSPSAPSAAAPNVAELVMLLKVREPYKGQRKSRKRACQG